MGKWHQGGRTRCTGRHAADDVSLKEAFASCADQKTFIPTDWHYRPAPYCWAACTACALKYFNERPPGDEAGGTKASGFIEFEAADGSDFGAGIFVDDTTGVNFSTTRSSRIRYVSEGICIWRLRLEAVTAGKASNLEPGRRLVLRGHPRIKATVVTPFVGGTDPKPAASPGPYSWMTPAERKAALADPATNRECIEAIERLDATGGYDHQTRAASAPPAPRSASVHITAPSTSVMLAAGAIRINRPKGFAGVAPEPFSPSAQAITAALGECDQRRSHEETVAWELFRTDARVIAKITKVSEGGTPCDCDEIVPCMDAEDQSVCSVHPHVRYRKAMNRAWGDVVDDYHFPPREPDLRKECEVRAAAMMPGLRRGR